MHNTVKQCKSILQFEKSIAVRVNRRNYKGHLNMPLTEKIQLQRDYKERREVEVTRNTRKRKCDLDSDFISTRADNSHNTNRLNTKKKKQAQKREANKKRCDAKRKKFVEMQNQLKQLRTQNESLKKKSVKPKTEAG